MSGAGRAGRPPGASRGKLVAGAVQTLERFGAKRQLEIAWQL